MHYETSSNPFSVGREGVKERKTGLWAGSFFSTVSREVGVNNLGNVDNSEYEL